MESRLILRTLEELAECANDEGFDEIPEDIYESVKFHVDILLQMGFLRVGIVDDNTIVYTCADHITKTLCLTITNEIQKKIMQVFISNKKGTFVLFNTQKGKGSIISKKIKDIHDNTNLKPVYFVVVSNDKTLADQTAEAIQKTVSTDNNYELFTLSSNSSVSVTNIKMYIDAYA